VLLDALGDVSVSSSSTWPGGWLLSACCVNTDGPSA